ncbi:hypothetical protein [Salmonirosea aquatica]|uniref:Uncharacterized protein n=1 Tax=Salmonirosea aquatica TaxID=2654236 RepID=A0A7C9F4D8_9BACT|nr:hypothetical protein [Cytophagaceae bacterium SJW1-29]
MGLDQNVLKAPNHYSTWLSLGLTLFPMLAYSIYLWTNTANLPYADDIPAILKAITDYLSGRNSLLEVLFRRHNEHPILLARLMAITQVLLIGEVNFKTLALIGSCSLIGIAFLLWRVSGINRSQLIYFAPVCFILFQAQLVSASIWTMVVWSNIMVIFTAFLSLWWLTLPGKRFIWLAATLLFATVFINGNGLLLIPAGLVVLYLSRSGTEHWVLWSLVSMIALFFYSQTGEPISFPQLSLTFFIATLINWMAFIGAYFSLVAHTMDYISIGMGFLIGGVLLSYVILAFALRARPSLSYNWMNPNPVLCGIITFVLLTALSVALLRNEGFDVTQMLYGRYRQYSVTATCLGYLVILSFIKTRYATLGWLFPVVLIFTAFWNMAAYIRYERFVSFYSRDLQASMYSMFYNDVALLHTPWYDRNNFTPFFKEAVRKGYYSPPLSKFPTPRQILKAIGTQEDGPVSINEKRLTGEENLFGCHKKLILDNYGYDHPQPTSTGDFGKELYLAFYQKDIVHLVAASTVTPLFQKNENVNWQAQLPLCRLRPGSYRVSSLSIDHGRIRAHRIPYELIIPQHATLEKLENPQIR